MEPEAFPIQWQFDAICRRSSDFVVVNFRMFLIFVNPKIWVSMVRKKCCKSFPQIISQFIVSQIFFIDHVMQFEGKIIRSFQEIYFLEYWRLKTDTIFRLIVIIKTQFFLTILTNFLYFFPMRGPLKIQSFNQNFSKFLRIFCTYIGRPGPKK